MTRAPGSRLGPYKVVSPLGAGGMGEVWLAHDERLGRDVAIKSLPEAFARDPERLTRFEREARLLASLNHPNIAGIHGLEESEGHRYLILEFVEGETLEARLGRGPLPVDETLEIAAQIALALETAHENGVVHRDLKPGNVMLTPAGEVKVLDFGLAKGGDGGSSASNLSVSPTLTHHVTEAGVILGTAAYMSPEQARGRRVDRRTDIWSFGCVLYECLTGKKAFEGETVSDLIAKILEREPEWEALPDRTPPGVLTLVRRCLSKDPSLRLRDIGEARIALTGGDATGAVPGAAVQPAPRSTRSVFPMWILAVAAVVVASVAVMTILPRGEPGRAPLWLSVLVPPGDRIDAGPEFNVVTIAPNGRSVAYVGRRQGTHQLYLRRLDERSLAALPGTEGARNPFFSPDGEWVGFFAGDKLKKVSVRGGTPVDLADVIRDRGGAWAEDGSIVFTPSFGNPLFRVSDSGGEPEPLTSLDSTRAERTHRWPAVIPGSEWILFTVGATDSPGNYDDARIETVSLRTGERRPVARGSFARYAPGGHVLVGRSGSLYALPMNPDNPRESGSGRPVLDGVLGEPTSGAVFFDIARNGALAYVPGWADRDRSLLAWIDLSGRLTKIPTEAMAYRKIALSPDGDRALLEIGPGSGASSDVWLLDLQKSTMSRLTFGGVSDNPLWMPDGKRFIWKEGEKMLVRSIDGPDTARSFAEISGIQTITDVTPDGSMVLFSEYGKVESDVWSVPVDGSREPQVEVGGPLGQARGVVSPDGRWIAYTSDQTGQREVCLRPWRRPGALSQITRGGAEAAMWGPDSRTLFFVSHGTMYRVALTPEGNALRAETPERLFDIDVSTDSSFQDVTLHPSGLKFLARVGEGANERREIGIVPRWASSLSEPQ